MPVAGIIAEYNPFHNGHEYHIRATRMGGAEHIIVVMSGNFVQRGDFAICDKWMRAKAALYGGADIVLELPEQYAVASAQRFAKGAVDTLKATGVVDTLSFGSESGDLGLLTRAARAVDSDEIQDCIRDNLSAGKTYAAARSAAAAEISQDIAEILANPNDTLAVEYLRAIGDSNIKPLCIARDGALHDSSDGTDFFRSASEIRRRISCKENYMQFVPEYCGKIFFDAVESGRAPVFSQCSERSIIALLRSRDREYFDSLPDISEGLQNRIYDAVRAGTTLDEIYSLAKTKRYTHARIRRIILAATLDIDYKTPPQYLRVLGFRKDAAELLGAIARSGSLPICTSYADAQTIGAAAKTQFERSAKYTDFYTLLQPSPLCCGEEMRQSVIKI